MAKINQLQVGGTNHDIASSNAFTITLPVAGWSSKQQVISNANFQASGYSYVVTPASGSLKAYTEAEIYADDITTNGQIRFHCENVPTAAITVNVTRTVVL